MLKKVITIGAMSCAMVGAMALPALADAEFRQPIPFSDCALNTKVSTTIDPQASPPFDPTGSKVGVDCS